MMIRSATPPPAAPAIMAMGKPSSSSPDGTTVVIVGSEVTATVSPVAAESLPLALAAVPQLVLRALSTEDASMSCGTVTSELIATEPAVTVVSTSEGSTPTSVATEFEMLLIFAVV